VVLVLDGVHVLHSRPDRAALSALADHVPTGSRLVLAGRDQPPLRIARLRAEGRITEIGRADLSLTAAEASSLLRQTGVVLGEAEAAELYRRTEGWAAGLYLAALAIRDGGAPPGAAGSVGGDDRFIADYLESEFLARISPRDREFLVRTAVLERMCGPLCEAVLERPGAAAALAELARSNLLLVPLDRRGMWYRYHYLFRDMLRAELERTEPGLVPVLQRRAAAWCLGRGLPEQAPAHSVPADELPPRRSGPDAPAGEAAGLRARVAAGRGSHVPGASALTTAERRILPLLGTHLSFREIAAELFVSRHTVRSQAMSVYRKLGASSRSQAVARSRELGLLDGTLRPVRAEAARGG